MAFAAPEYGPEACPTLRAPPTDRTVPDSKRACAVPVLAQQLPLAATLLANRHTIIGKSTPDLKTVWGTGSDYNMRLAATTEAVGVINRVDICDPSKVAQVLSLVAGYCDAMAELVGQIGQGFMTARALTCLRYRLGIKRRASKRAIPARTRSTPARRTPGTAPPRARAPRPAPRAPRPARAPTPRVSPAACARRLARACPAGVADISLAFI